MRIGELSRRSGVSVRMLRYYEEQGVLRPGRRESGYRDYDAADEQLVRRVRMFGEAGLKLEAIRVLLPCVVNDGLELELCDRVRATLAHEIGSIETRLAQLGCSRDILKRYLQQDAARPERARLEP